MKQFLLSLSVWMCLSVAAPVSQSNASVPPPGSNRFKQDVPIYPNPAKDHIFLRLDQANTSNIEIRNILGNKMPLMLERTSFGTYRIDLAQYPSGYYLVIIQDEAVSANGIRQKNIYKFLKQ